MTYKGLKKDITELLEAMERAPADRDRLQATLRAKVDQIETLDSLGTPRRLREFRASELDVEDLFDNIPV